MNHEQAQSNRSPFAMTPWWLLRDPEVEPLDKALYGLLATFTTNGQRRTVGPIHTTLGDYLGVSRDTVIRALKRLEHRGAIRILRTKNNPNVYLLTDVDPRPEMIEDAKSRHPAFTQVAPVRPEKNKFQVAPVQPGSTHATPEVAPVQPTADTESTSSISAMPSIHEEDDLSAGKKNQPVSQIGDSGTNVHLIVTPASSGYEEFAAYSTEELMEIIINEFSTYNMGKDMAKAKEEGTEPDRSRLGKFLRGRIEAGELKKMPLTRAEQKAKDDLYYDWLSWKSAIGSDPMVPEKARLRIARCDVETVIRIGSRDWREIIAYLNGETPRTDEPGEDTPTP